MARTPATSAKLKGPFVLAARRTPGASSMKQSRNDRRQRMLSCALSAGSTNWSVAGTRRRSATSAAPYAGSTLPGRYAGCGASSPASRNERSPNRNSARRAAIRSTTGTSSSLTSTTPAPDRVKQPKINETPAYGNRLSGFAGIPSGFYFLTSCQESVLPVRAHEHKTEIRPHRRPLKTRAASHAYIQTVAGIQVPSKRFPAWRDALLGSFSNPAPAALDGRRGHFPLIDAPVGPPRCRSGPNARRPVCGRCQRPPAGPD